MRILFFLALLFSCIAAISQQVKRLTPLTSADVGLLSVAVTHSPVISRKFIADMSIGIGPGYDIAEGYHTLKVLPAVFASVTPKYYYNHDKRSGNDKNTAFNSGNFLGAKVKYSHPVFVKTDDIRQALLVNAFWGLQRQLNQSWFFGAQAGIGYSWDVSSENKFGTIYPALDFRFGYIFCKSQRHLRREK
jgi:hypothetical protein